MTTILDMRRTSFIRRSLLLSLMFMLCLASCKRQKPDPMPIETEVIAPGAAGWDELTMQLPAGSPAVIRARPDAALEAMDAAFDWMVADAAMFGPGAEGEERVKGLNALRADIASSFGSDPIELSTWSDMGVALDAPTYIGFHPLSTSGRAFVNTVEQELSSRLDIKDLPLAEALRIKGDEVDRTGLYSAVNKASRHEDAGLGVRMVLGLNDEAKALDRIDGVFSDDEYQRVARVSNPSIRRVYFTDRDEDVLTFVVRVEEEGKALVLDMFYLPVLQATGRDERQQEIMAGVDALLVRTPPGRAAAPSPSQESVASLGMNQDGISEILRYVAYREAIVNASSEAAAARDEQVYYLLGLSVLQMSYWDTGARGIQGINYEFDVGGDFEGSARMFGFQMELFGEPGLMPPPVRDAARTLGVEQSGVGLSMDPAMIFSEQWRTWLGPKDGVKLLEVMSNQFDMGPQTDLESFFLVLAMPRLFAQLMTVVEREAKEEIPVELIPVYAQREQIIRVEAVVPGLDASNMWRDPNFLILLTLSPDLSPLDRDALSAALRDTLYYTFDFTKEEPLEGQDAPGALEEEDYERAQAMKPGAVSAFMVPASNPLSKMFYYYDRDASTPYIVLSRGSQAEQNLKAFLEADLSRKPVSGSFRLKLDPSMLLQMANSYEESSFELLDLPILTQRLGAMLFNITPGKSQDGGVITYRFDLMAPARLDSGP